MSLSMVNNALSAGAEHVWHWRPTHLVLKLLLLGTVERLKSKNRL